MRLNLRHPARLNQDVALYELAEMERKHEALSWSYGQQKPRSFGKTLLVAAFIFCSVFVAGCWLLITWLKGWSF